MATRTWNGAAASFQTAADWSPVGVPTSGDIAVINAGTVSASGVISGATVEVNQANGATTSTTLALNGATLDSASTLVVSNAQTLTTATPAVISVSGTATLAGTGTFYGTQTQFAIASGSTLVNTGTMDFYSSSPVTTGGGTLQNDGTIAFVNPASTSQGTVLNDAITGNGIIALGEHARLDITGPVGFDQGIVLNDGPSGNEILVLESPASMSGFINGFSASDTLFLIDGGAFTGASYTPTGFFNGFLTINNTAGSYNLQLQGQYSLGSFSFTEDDFGNGKYTLQVNTTAHNGISSGLPSGYSNGGNGALPVYRFFDSVVGTHLFTQSLGEAQQIVAGRPDLKEETNNFGAVSPSTPSSEPVYRFYESGNGSHFFTASSAEFLGLTTPGSASYRSDFTYESSSTFYEDATQRAGDVAVYRLFDEVHGTQLLTGSQGEYQGLTTPGSGSYRGDLTPEGIAFYAPTGTFTA